MKFPALLACCAALAATTLAAENGKQLKGPEWAHFKGNPGFTGVDTFPYTICELPGVAPSGLPATGLCDTATVTVTVNPTGSGNEGPGPEASFRRS